jgi:hypothetical protein
MFAMLSSCGQPFLAQVATFASSFFWLFSMAVSSFLLTASMSALVYGLIVLFGSQGQGLTALPSSGDETCFEFASPFDETFSGVPPAVIPELARART